MRRQGDNTFSGAFRWSVIALLVAAVLTHQPLRRVAVTLFRLPLTVTESLLGVLIGLPRLPGLTQETARLRAELARSQLELVRLQETVRYLASSRQLTQASSQPSGLVASVIGRTIVPTHDTLILDKGSRDGIVSESPIVHLDGVVGRIVEVHPTTSLALFVTDPNSRIACLVERSRESGLLVGSGDGSCQLIYLDIDADLVVGDRIVTAGLGGPFPKGLPVGTIVKVVRHERSGTATARVRPAVRMHQLEEVLCLPPAS